MAYFPHHRHFGYGGFGHGGFAHRRRPWLFRHHHGLPWGQGGSDDGDDGGADPSPPSPPSPLSLPFPLPLPSLETSEAEAERYRRHHRWRSDDQEMGLNDEPFDARGADAPTLARRGRWVLRDGKLILYGV